MPEMDGYQATAKLRSDRALRASADHRHDRARDDRGTPALSRRRHERSCRQAHRSRRFCSRRWRDSTNRRKSHRRRTCVHVPASVTRRWSCGCSPGTPTAQRNPLHLPSADRLPSIAGLDTESGLSRVGGNDKLYLKLLPAVYRASRAPLLQQVTDALAAGRHRPRPTDRPLAQEEWRAVSELHVHPLPAFWKRRFATAPRRTTWRRRNNRSPLSLPAPGRRIWKGAMAPTASEYLPRSTADNTPADRPRSRELAAQLPCSFRNPMPGRPISSRPHRASLQPLFGDGAWTEFEKLARRATPSMMLRRVWSKRSSVLPPDERRRMTSRRGSAAVSSTSSAGAF